MSTYCWIITRDFLAENDDESEVGVIGPHDASDNQINKLKAGLGKRFRMYDDDGELYYEGRIVFKYGLDGEVEHRKVDGFKGLVCCAGVPEEGFGPLDDFGRPNAGCTEIRYFDKKGRLGGL